MGEKLQPFRLGIDLGGTKIEGVALSSTGSIVARHRIPTPRTYDSVVEGIVSLVGRLEAEVEGIGTVGIGTPGSISPATGLMRNANSTFLNGRPLREDIEAALGRPIRMANDANCFALSEATDGAGAGARVVFGVIIGTGCGGGVVIDGQVLEGASGIAGEWGHSPLPWPSAEENPGPQCWCGKYGCLETWLSGPGWAARHAERVGGHAGPEAIVAAFEAGDAEAEASLNRYADRLARALAAVMNLIDPDVVVLGGGVSNIDALYPRVMARIPAWVFSDHVAMKLRRNVHGDSSGVRGAAWLWPATQQLGEPR